MFELAFKHFELVALTITIAGFLTELLRELINVVYVTLFLEFLQLLFQRFCPELLSHTFLAQIGNHLLALNERIGQVVCAKLMSPRIALSPECSLTLTSPSLELFLKTTDCVLGVFKFAVLVG
jgi:hypothetical protein